MLAIPPSLPVYCFCCQPQRKNVLPFDCAESETPFSANSLDIVSESSLVSVKSPQNRLFHLGETELSGDTVIDSPFGLKQNGDDINYDVSPLSNQVGSPQIAPMVPDFYPIPEQVITTISQLKESCENALMASDIVGESAAVNAKLALRFITIKNFKHISLNTGLQLFLLLIGVNEFTRRPKTSASVILNWQQHLINSGEMPESCRILLIHPLISKSLDKDLLQQLTSKDSSSTQRIRFSSSRLEKAITLIYTYRDELEKRNIQSSRIHIYHPLSSQIFFRSALQYMYTSHSEFLSLKLSLKCDTNSSLTNLWAMQFCLAYHHLRFGALQEAMALFGQIFRSFTCSKTPFPLIRHQGLVKGLLERAFNQGEQLFMSSSFPKKVFDSISTAQVFINKAETLDILLLVVMCEMQCALQMNNHRAAIVHFESFIDVICHSLLSTSNPLAEGDEKSASNSMRLFSVCIFLIMSYASVLQLLLASPLHHSDIVAETPFSTTSNLDPPPISSDISTPSDFHPSPKLLTFSQSSSTLSSCPNSLDPPCSKLLALFHDFFRCTSSGCKKHSKEANDMSSYCMACRSPSLWYRMEEGLIHLSSLKDEISVVSELWFEIISLSISLRTLLLQVGVYLNYVPFPTIATQLGKMGYDRKKPWRSIFPSLAPLTFTEDEIKLVRNKKLSLVGLSNEMSFHYSYLYLTALSAEMSNQIHYFHMESMLWLDFTSFCSAQQKSLEVSLPIACRVFCYFQRFSLPSIKSVAEDALLRCLFPNWLAPISSQSTNHECKFELTFELAEKYIPWDSIPLFFHIILHRYKNSVAYHMDAHDSPKLCFQTFCSLLYSYHQKISQNPSRGSLQGDTHKLLTFPSHLMFTPTVIGSIVPPPCSLVNSGGNDDNLADGVKENGWRSFFVERLSGIAEVFKGPEEKWHESMPLCSGKSITESWGFSWEPISIGKNEELGSLSSTTKEHYIGGVFRTAAPWECWGPSLTTANTFVASSSVPGRYLKWELTLKSLGQSCFPTSPLVSSSEKNNLAENDSMKHNMSSGDIVNVVVCQEVVFASFLISPVEAPSTGMTYPGWYAVIWKLPPGLAYGSYHLFSVNVILSPTNASISFIPPAHFNSSFSSPSSDIIPLEEYLVNLVSPIHLSKGISPDCSYLSILARTIQCHPSHNLSEEEFSPPSGNNRLRENVISPIDFCERGGEVIINEGREKIFKGQEQWIEVLTTRHYGFLRPLLYVCPPYSWQISQFKADIIISDKWGHECQLWNQKNDSVCSCYNEHYFSGIPFFLTLQFILTPPLLLPSLIPSRNIPFDGARITVKRLTHEYPSRRASNCSQVGKISNQEIVEAALEEKVSSSISSQIWRHLQNLAMRRMETGSSQENVWVEVWNSNTFSESFPTEDNATPPSDICIMMVSERQAEGQLLENHELIEDESLMWGYLPEVVWNTTIVFVTNSPFRILDENMQEKVMKEVVVVRPISSCDQSPSSTGKHDYAELPFSLLPLSSSDLFPAKHQWDLCGEQSLIASQPLQVCVQIPFTPLCRFPSDNCQISTEYTSLASSWEVHLSTSLSSPVANSKEIDSYDLTAQMLKVPWSLHSPMRLHYKVEPLSYREENKWVVMVYVYNTLQRTNLQIQYIKLCPIIIGSSNSYECLVTPLSGKAHERLYHTSLLANGKSCHIFGFSIHLIRNKEDVMSTSFSQALGSVKKLDKLLTLQCMVWYSIEGKFFDRNWTLKNCSAVESVFLQRNQIKNNDIKGFTDADWPPCDWIYLTNLFLSRPIAMKVSQAPWIYMQLTKVAPSDPDSVVHLYESVIFEIRMTGSNAIDWDRFLMEPRGVWLLHIDVNGKDWILMDRCIQQVWWCEETNLNKLGSLSSLSVEKSENYSLCPWKESSNPFTVNFSAKPIRVGPCQLPTIRLTYHVYNFSDTLSNLNELSLPDDIAIQSNDFCIPVYLDRKEDEIVVFDENSPSSSS